jgi:hypothetical protein
MQTLLDRACGLLIRMAGFWRGLGAVKGALRASPPLLSQRVP